MILQGHFPSFTLKYWQKVLTCDPLCENNKLFFIKRLSAGNTQSFLNLFHSFFRIEFLYEGFKSMLIRISMYLFVSLTGMSVRSNSKLRYLHNYHQYLYLSIFSGNFNLSMMVFH